MLASFTRSAARGLRKAQEVRMFSAGGSQAEHIEVMEKWKKISLVGFPCVALFGTFVMIRHFSHEHGHHEKIAYPHMKIRSKPFPWGSKDCDLFDFACKRDARAGASAE